MRGLWAHDGELTLKEEIHTPRAAASEALVRVQLAGICATDLEILKGYVPFDGVLGHEFVGEIVACDDEPTRIGERVVGEINAACGMCARCRQGLGRHCEERTVLGIVGRNGAHGELLTLPCENLLAVPDAVADEQAVFVEPLAAALEILEQTHIGPGDRVLLVGAGRLGQLIARVLRLTGCELVVVAKYPRQRELLAPLGVTLDQPAEVPLRTFDYAVEASGSPEAFQLARQSLKPRGTLILKSTYAGESTIDLAPVVVDELTLLGSRCGPFAPALRLLAAGLVDCAALIEQRYPLAEGLAAYDHAAQPGAMKVLLEP